MRQALNLSLEVEEGVVQLDISSVNLETSEANSHSTLRFILNNTSLLRIQEAINNQLVRYLTQQQQQQKEMKSDRPTR